MKTTHKDIEMIYNIKTQFLCLLIFESAYGFCVMKCTTFIIFHFVSIFSVLDIYASQIIGCLIQIYVSFIFGFFFSFFLSRPTYSFTALQLYSFTKCVDTNVTYETNFIQGACDFSYLWVVFSLKNIPFLLYTS